MPNSTALTHSTMSMIRGGSPTVFVTSVSRAVSFYTETLGLKLQYQAAEHFAMIDAGDGLSIGLHPATPGAPPPGTGGSIEIGLNVSQPIELVVSDLKRRGVSFHRGIIDDGTVKLAPFHDPDGNSLYLFEVIH